MFFPKLILTDAGRALIVKALNGTAINFTKFALGDGTAPKEPRKLKALVHLAANMQINSINRSLQKTLRVSRERNFTTSTGRDTGISVCLPVIVFTDY